MFQLITLLCLSAPLDAAHHYGRSASWEDSFKNRFSSRATTKRYSGSMIHHGTDTQNRKMQLHDSSRNYGGFGSPRNYGNPMSSFAYPRKRFDDVKQTKPYSSRGSNNKTKYTGGRGLMKNFIDSIRKEGVVGGLKHAVQNTVDKTWGIVNDTAKITNDLVRGSAQIVKNVVQNSAMLTKDVVRGSLDITRKAFNWAVGKTIKIGKVVVQVPLQSIELTVNAAWAVHTFGVGLTAQMISDTADWFQGNWEAVKVMEFPGKHLIVMMYPTGLMSIVNTLTKEIVYMLDEGHKMMNHAFAYTIYVSLKYVFDTVNTVMALSQLDCIKLVPQTIKVNKLLVSTVRTESGKICGISHLKPENNVTITRNDEKFLIITTPWVLNDLSVHLTGVKVMGANDTLIDGEVLDTTVTKIKATGTVSFEAGTLLRFVSIAITVDDMEGLNVRFPTKHKSYLMDYIETLSNYFRGLVEKEINHALKIMESKVFNYIANI